MRHVRALASEALGGRYAGSDGERQASLYISGVLDASGVGPLPPDRRFHELDARGGWWEAASPRSRNVLGHLASSDAVLAGEIVVVGAHYDHLGRRGGETYLGADDNASGVAVVLEIARALAPRRAELGRSVLFAFFGAEEIGLLGARAFVAEAPPRAAGPVSEAVVPPEAIAVMINVDMVGRTLLDHVGASIPMRAMGIDPERALGVIGLGGRPALRAFVDRAFGEQGLTAIGTEDLPPVLQQLVEEQSDGRGDSFPFERAGVPSLFFSNGTHSDYHEPSDTPDRLRPDLMARRGRAIAELVVALSRAPRADLPRSTGSPFGALARP